MLGRARGWWSPEARLKEPVEYSGLKNFGNTCFFTSTLQCLLHTHVGAARTGKSAPTLMVTKRDLIIGECEITQCRAADGQGAIAVQLRDLHSR